MQTELPRPDLGFLPWWFLATMAGAALGIATIPITDDPRGPIMVAGFACGVGQWWVLRRYLSSARWWVAASTFGVGVALLVTFSVSIILYVLNGALLRSPNSEWTLLPVSVLPGLVIGFAQQLVVRRQFGMAWAWVLINLGALGGATVIVTVITNLLFETPYDLLGSFDLVPLAAGWSLLAAIYAAITGAGMFWLLRHAPPAVGEVARPSIGPRWVQVATAIVGVVTALMLIVSLKPHLPPGVPDDYSTSWLTQKPCAAPCWNGITPGRTTSAAAIEMLKADPAIDAASVKAIHVGTDYLAWSWAGSQFGGGGELSSSTSDAVFKEITPQFNSLPGADYRFTLRDVMATYGEPSHVYASAQYGIDVGPLYSVAVIYDRYGLLLGGLSNTGLNKALDIRPAMRFETVSFYALPMELPGGAVPWQGPQPFAFYCRGETPTNNACP